MIQIYLFPFSISLTLMTLTLGRMRQSAALAPFVRVSLMLLALMVGPACGKSNTTKSDNKTIDPVNNVVIRTPDQILTCTGDSAFIQVAAAARLDKIIELPGKCLLYAIDSSGTKLYRIDTIADITTVVEVGNRPMDITFSSDFRQLYVAIYGDKKIVILNALTGESEDEFFTAKAPFQIANGSNNRLFYVSDGPTSQIFGIDLNAQNETTMLPTSLRSPAITTNRAGTELFAGEATHDHPQLLVYDATESAPLFPLDGYVFDGSFGIAAPIRQLVLAEDIGRIYYADRSFNTDDLKRIRGMFGAPIIATSHDSNTVATQGLLYDARTFRSIANRSYVEASNSGWVNGVHFSADGKWLYEFETLGALLHRTALDSLIGAVTLGRTDVAPGSLYEHRFGISRLIVDPTKNTIYALETQQNSLLFIDKTTRQPERALVVGSAPSDMSMLADGSAMVIATFGASEISVIDLIDESQALKNSFVIRGNPFRIAVGNGNKIAFVEQDQMTDVGLVDFNSGATLGRVENSLFQPDVVFDATGDFLFAGEGAGTTSWLRRYNIAAGTFNQVAITSAAYSYPDRNIVLAGLHIYYAGRQFLASDLTELGDFGEEIVTVTPNDRYAISRRRVYNASTFALVDGLPVSSDLIAADPDNLRLWIFDNTTGTLLEYMLPTL